MIVNLKLSPDDDAAITFLIALGYFVAAGDQKNLTLMRGQAEKISDQVSRLLGIAHDK